MSISSTLIHACLSNVQKEFNQLEHWLNSLHPQMVAPASSLPYNGLESALRELSSKIDTLSKQYDVQQLAINHIVDRLDMLEGGQQIQVSDDPWLDSSDIMENVVVEPAESVYVIHKEEESVAPTSPIHSALNTAFYEEPVEAVKPAQAALPVEVVEPALPAQPVQEEQEEQEEIQEEEEDDGVELSEITYKDKTYYKDGENFVYGIDDEGQPSEQPIGIWKDKTQTISFYRLK